jgi:hypothetical protein
MYEKMSDAWEAWDRRDDVAVKAAAAGPWRTDWANVPHGTILRKWENGTVDVGEGYPHVNKNLRLVAWAEINTEGL